MSDWQIDPETLNLVSPHPAGHRFTTEEFAAQEWPPCPICGTTVRVSRTQMKDMAHETPTYLPNRWECPRGCNPRQP